MQNWNAAAMQQSKDKTYQQKSSSLRPGLQCLQKVFQDSRHSPPKPKKTAIEAGHSSILEVLILTFQFGPSIKLKNNGSMW